MLHFKSNAFAFNVNKIEEMPLDENDRNATSEMSLTNFWGCITTGAFAHPVLGWTQAHKENQLVN